ncbi:hypothetical protein [Endozoicomonas sp. ALC066]|uniref:hypothetical protein n=1 Tax=Endozoicomonas sp. ALC066 TaxID=3403078 RepID=UPI003BB79B5F
MSKFTYRGFQPEYLLLDLREASSELFSSDPSPYGIADSILKKENVSWDNLILRAIGQKKTDFVNGLQDQAENWVRGSSSFICKDDAQFALDAYKAVFQNDALTSGVSAFVEFLLKLVARECSHVFGPNSNWIVEASEDGELAVVDAGSNKSDGIISFKTDDGFTFSYCHDTSIWTDGDMEFETIHGHQDIFGWPVDDEGLPLFGYMTFQRVDNSGVSSSFDEQEIAF